MLENYPGSKGAEGVWQRIISEMPPHRIYVEPFVGSGVIARRKRSASETFCVDADSAVINFFRAAATDEIGEARSATFVCDRAERWLPKFFFSKLHQPESSDVLVYCDPPYLMETRSSQRMLYDHELVSDQEHAELLDILKKLPAMVMISGYWSELYDRELTGWRAIQIPTVKRNGERAIEFVWCNFPEPVQLHDYRFLGEGYRERERIRKKMSRWKAKLRAMPGLERSALFWAMSQYSK